jgi:signal peptidase I
VAVDGEKIIKRIVGLEGDVVKTLGYKNKYEITDLNQQLL